jgi:hypothetical protein
MAITSTRITVGTEPTLLVPVSNQPQRVQLLNAGGEVVRIGGPDVTTAAFGLPRLPDNPNVARTQFTFDLNPGESIWAVVAQNTSEVNAWIQIP